MHHQSTNNTIVAPNEESPRQQRIRMKVNMTREYKTKIEDDFKD